MKLPRPPVFVVALVATVCMVLTPQSFAWGPDGHRIVALIAKARLNPQAAAEVKKLFDTDPLEQWANWPDDIRRDRPETAPWHFVDIPTSAATYDPARDSNGGANIIDAIDRNEKILGDRSQTKVARAEALSFVVHLIGDVHQPLHAADRDHDKGGNARLVFLLDQARSLNLHSAWDSGILKTEILNNSDAVVASALNARISKADAEKWCKGTVVDWVNESHQLAVNVAYAGVPETGAPPRLDRAYVDRALPVINTQLERGGVRLAYELNRILGGAATTAPTTAPVGLSTTMKSDTRTTRPD